MTPDDTDAFERKAALRRQLKLARAALPQDGRDQGAERCRARLGGWLERLPATVISGFWPLPGELDLAPVLERLAEAGHTIALPRMQGQARPLAFHVYRPGDHLIQGAFGVQEPAPDAPSVRPRIVLVPLLAFDHSGNRLGYGKGFYDRTLAALRGDDPDLLAIGVAFALQEVAEVPITPGDRPLDAVVTEAGIMPVAARVRALIEAAPGV